MCLIHSLNVTTVLSNEWLRDIYSSNADGIGFLGFEGDTLVARKVVPKNQRRALKWFRSQVEGREGYVHWRYRTHGDVDLDNCHPYPVLTMAEDGVDMYLMHNGVLSEFDETTELEDVMYGGQRYNWGTFNRTKVVSDTRSDTFHFIRSVLHPMLKPSLGGNPDVIHNRAVQALIAALIGDSNKFVIADSNHPRQFVVINHHEFRPWAFYGLECSNGYAWSSDSHKYDKPLPRKVYVPGDPRLATTSTSLTIAPVKYGKWYENDPDDEVLLGGEAMSPSAFEESYTEHCRDMQALYDDTVAVFPNLGAVFDGTSFIEYADMYGADVLKNMIEDLMDQKMTEAQFADEISEQIKL